MLAGKKIILGITGSIAAYKAPIIVRGLVKAGAEVKVIMTPAAEQFVSRLTLSTLSRNPVLTGLFDEEGWANHVMLGRWADVFLVAPLSCNTLSKMASGECDSLLMAVYLSATCPVVVAPAMDEDMWLHPATHRNLDLLRADGCFVVPVGHGELASGLIGPGRMAEPEELLAYLEQFLAVRGSLSGKKALVTAGPTYEAIDPVRFIGNHSSGKMGYALASELCRRGARVTLVSGPVSLPKPAGDIHLVKVRSAEEMHEACLQELDYDLAIMSAAVADYTPAVVAKQKIKKKEESFQLSLRKTRDILKSLGAQKKPGQFLVGFALETTSEREHALAKLESKNADLMVLNSLNDAGAGFGGDTNKVTLFFRAGAERELGLKSKTELAAEIVDSITELL